MQARRTVVLALALLVVTRFIGSGPARAGVYNTAEPEPPVLSPHFREFQESLIKVRNIANADLPNPLRENYLFIGGLAAKSPAGLTWQQRLDLSACLIRLQKPDEAIQLLKPAAAEDPKNFLIQSNLATAYHLSGLQVRALDSISAALSEWPADAGKLPEAQRQALLRIGWQKRSPDWYRKADTYFQKLLRLRQRELLRQQQDRSAELPKSVDALFDDGGKPPRPVQFVGDSGKYEPGKLAAAEKAKLPVDAVEIVEQLLLWLPLDARLYWLLGELLNAQGDVNAAEQIFNKLVRADNVRYHDLLEHRQVLLARPRADTDTGTGEAATSGASDERSCPPATTGDSGKVWSAEHWQALGVGFGAGILVTFLGYWQVREIARRRQQRAVSSRH